MKGYSSRKKGKHKIYLLVSQHGLRNSLAKRQEKISTGRLIVTRQEIVRGGEFVWKTEEIYLEYFRHGKWVEKDLPPHSFCLTGKCASRSPVLTTVYLTEADRNSSVFHEKERCLVQRSSFVILVTAVLHFVLKINVNDVDIKTAARTELAGWDFALRWCDAVSSRGATMTAVS